MHKDTKKNLVGQPIFKQIVKFIPKSLFHQLTTKHKSDRYYKSFSSWDQLVTLLFGILTRCDSARETCDAMAALGGKLNYLGMDCSPAKSTFGDALRNRNCIIFEQFFFALVSYFSPLFSDSRKKDVNFEDFFFFYSTTISLFSNVLKGAGRNPKGDGKKKGGLKVHLLTDVHADTPKFARITEAKQHDKNFLKFLKLPALSMIVFDKAYTLYRQFAEWTQQQIFFVCRLKDNAVYQVQEVISEISLCENQHGVLMEEHIHMMYSEKKGGKKTKTLCLRKVTYRAEDGIVYTFITNNWAISAEEVALIYKCRWSIETSFKKLKQNFQLRYFYSETENGIKTQVWCTLIAYLLLMVLKHMTRSKKAFSTIAALIRIHLISHLDLKWVVQSGRRTYAKRAKTRNKSPGVIQQELFLEF
jgi:hypothetical protein